MRSLSGLIVLGAIFGILGAIAVFINSYEGYSHFPGIPKKRIIMSFEYAIIAFIMAVIAVIVVFFLLIKKS